MAARIDLSEVRPGAEIIVYGTVLPERGKDNHAAAIREQAVDWKYLRETYTSAIFCVAGDFNSDMGRAKEYGYPHFFGPKYSTDLLVSVLGERQMRTVTDHAFPEGLKPKYPPIDHIALSAPHADLARIGATWAGRKGDGQTVNERIGIVVNVGMQNFR